MKNLANIIECVKNNGAKWSEWKSADHILDAYLASESEYDDYYGPINSVKPLLSRAIKSNGKSLEGDLFDLKQLRNLIETQRQGRPHLTNEDQDHENRTT